MEFDIFKEILLAAKQIDKIIKGFEDLLDCQLVDSALVDTQISLIDLLIDKCEYDTGEDPAIYRYAFECNWGEKPYTYYIKGEKYVVDSPESLYKYVTEKFDFEFTKGDI